MPTNCYTYLNMNPKEKAGLGKIIAFVVAGISGLAALITALFYDWTNKGPDEAGPFGNSRLVE